MRTSEVSRTTEYTPNHPRWYRTKVSTYWWLWKWPYLKFVLREFSSVPGAYFVVLTLVQIRCLSEGPGAYAKFQQWMKSPILLALNGISLFFVLFHMLTWFNLAPRAMVVRLGGKRVAEPLVAGANYVAWIVVSVVVAWFILR